jgi:hypothetical protein
MEIFVKIQQPIKHQNVCSVEHPSDQKDQFPITLTRTLLLRPSKSHY